MRQNTLVTLGASVIFGGVAVFLARGWIDDAVRSEYQNAVPAAPADIAADTVETVPVLVFDVDVQFGDVLTPEAVRVVEMPVDAVPLGTFETANALFPDMSQRTVSLARMGRNEIVLDHKVSGPGARGSMSALITPGMRAVSVRVDDMAGVAGFVMPGDFVDVIYTRKEGARNTDRKGVSDVLLQNVKVMGIDQNLDQHSSDPDIAKTVTLEVSNRDAQRLQLAYDEGVLSLTLRSAGDTVIRAEATVKEASMLARAAKPVKARRRAPKPVSVPVPSAADKVANVTVIRGEDRDEVNVLSENDAPQSDLAGG